MPRIARPGIDKADEAMAANARQVKDTELIQWAAEIRCALSARRASRWLECLTLTPVSMAEMKRAAFGNHDDSAQRLPMSVSPRCSRLAGSPSPACPMPILKPLSLRPRRISLQKRCIE